MTRLKAHWLSLITLFAVAACSSEIQFSFFALGTDVSVTLYGVDSDTANQVEQEFIVMYSQYGRDLYPWADGELASVNRAIADGETVSGLSAELAQVIARARDIEILTQGRFNAGIGRLTELWQLHDLANTSVRVPDDASIRRARRGASLVSVDLNGLDLVRANRNTMIDPGGIAKGLILEASETILSEHQVTNAIVNIGGDLIVIGDRKAEIGIWSPTSNTAIAGITVLDQEVIVTSGSYERYIEVDGQRYPHVIDPRTGRPVQHTVSVTVIDMDAMLADAAATTLMVAGPREFRQTVRALNLTYALLLGASGELCLTQPMAERLDWLEENGRDEIAAAATGNASSACFIDNNGG